MSNKIIEIPFPDHHATWKSREYGIRDDREFKRWDRRSTAQRLKDAVRAALNEILYTFKTFGKRISAAFSKKSFDRFTDRNPIENKVEAVALAVFFHGLNGKESVWDGHRTYLQKQSAMIDVIAPRLPKGGHARIDGEDTRALEKRIVAWTREHPGMPVAFFGQSRGSMYAVQMETLLRETAPKTPVFVSSTGGVLFGSSKVDRLTRFIPPNRSHILTCGLLTKTACEELSDGNPTAKKLLEEARKPLREGVAVRHYEMFASLSDSHVTNPGSSLPLLAEGQERKTERHYLCPGYGHNSIVGSVIKKQIDDFVAWTKKTRGERS